MTEKLSAPTPESGEPRTGSHDTLTFDAILDAVRALGEPPRMRVIVGFPGIPEDQIRHRESDGLFLIGRTAYATLLKHAAPSPLASHAWPTLCGVRVEHYAYDDPSHARLLDEIYPLFALFTQTPPADV